MVGPKQQQQQQQQQQAQNSREQSRSAHHILDSGFVLINDKAVGGEQRHGAAGTRQHERGGSVQRQLRNVATLGQRQQRIVDAVMGQVADKKAAGRYICIQVAGERSDVACRRLSIGKTNSKTRFSWQATTHDLLRAAGIKISAIGRKLEASRT